MCRSEDNFVELHLDFPWAPGLNQSHQAYAASTLLTKSSFQPFLNGLEATALHGVVTQMHLYSDSKHPQLKKNENNCMDCVHHLIQTLM